MCMFLDRVARSSTAKRHAVRFAAVSCMALRQAWNPHNSLRLRAGLGCVAHDFAEAWQADS